MSTVTVRISDKTNNLLKNLAVECGASKTEIIQKAVDVYRRQLFFEGLNADFARLQADPIAWQEELEERKLWEGTLGDDLEEPYDA